MGENCFVYGDEYTILDTGSRLMRTEGEHLVVILAEISQPGL